MHLLPILFYYYANYNIIAIFVLLYEIIYNEINKKIIKMHFVLLLLFSIKNDDDHDHNDDANHDDYNND